MSFITSSLNKLNITGKKKHSHEPDADDVGDEVDNGTVAGGGHSARHSALRRGNLRVSTALQQFLVDRGLLSMDEANLETGENSDALRRLLAEPHFEVPRELLDMSHPLPEYFVSSSHNTYLMAHQLYGTSSATAYETALTAGSRCVEIDAWDNDADLDEPKVTHGYTLVSHIPVRAVAETIRDVLDKEAQLAQDDPAFQTSPIMISLENHCSARGQRAIVRIFEEVFGERLLNKAIELEGRPDPDPNHIPLKDIGHRVFVIVEYHFANEKTEDDSDSDSSSSDEEEKKAREEYKKRKKAEASTAIVPELAALGVYAQSVKPVDNSWFNPGVLLNGPHHHLINISETGLSKLVPENAVTISKHNAEHLMRVFPKGTRISSKNLEPVKYWSLGAQICALNWQTFNGGMQLNEALFTGTDGYVLKPEPLRAGGSGQVLNGRRKKLRLHIAGATDIAPPKGFGEGTDGGADWRPYVTCNLVSPGKCPGGRKQKTSAYRAEHKLGFLHDKKPPATEPVWDQTLEWEYDDSELVFLRILIKADLPMMVNPNLRVISVRLLYLKEGWKFLHMTDFGGRETDTTLLAKFDITDVE